MALVIRESIGYMVQQLVEDTGFNREQAKTLVDYLWDMSEDMGEDLEFCTTDIRATWNACTFDELREVYSNIEAFVDADCNLELIEAIQDRTEIAGSNEEWIIFRAF